MKVFRYIVVGVLYCLAQGCATPVKVKQSLVSIDEAYAGNAQLMNQYRELVESVNARHEYWNRHVRQLAQLNLALEWATTDPRRPGINDEKYVEKSCVILGTELVDWVNKNRLKELPARRGETAEIFTPGENDIESLVQALPSLTRPIEEKVRADYERLVRGEPKIPKDCTEEKKQKERTRENHEQKTPVNPSAFEEYQKNLAALRRINAMIKRYLDIDVTIKPQDVKEIAEAIRTLQ